MNLTKHNDLSNFAEGDAISINYIASVELLGVVKKKEYDDYYKCFIIEVEIRYHYDSRDRTLTEHNITTNVTEFYDKIIKKVKPSYIEEYKIGA